MNDQKLDKMPDEIMRTRSYETMNHYKEASTQQIGFVRSKTNQISTIIKEEMRVKQHERVLEGKGKRGMDNWENEEYKKWMTRREEGKYQMREKEH